MAGPEFSPTSDEEWAAKTALHEGDAKTLNVYATRTAGSSWGTFPWRYRSEPLRDGIVLNEPHFFGGAAVGNSDGDIAVHEVGHWLGLWHTFQGGCTGAQDSCTAPGTDPVHNSMNYLLDACAARFSVGQVDRMETQWSTYRAVTTTGGGKPGKGLGRK